MCVTHALVNRYIHLKIWILKNSIKKKIKWRLTKCTRVNFSLNTRKNATSPPRSLRIVTSGSSIDTYKADREDDLWTTREWWHAFLLRFWFMDHLPMSRTVVRRTIINLPRDEATSSPDPRRLGTETIEYREEPSRVVSASSARARPSSDTLAPSVPFWTTALFSVSRSLMCFAPKLPSARISRLRRGDRYDLQAQLMSRHNRRAVQMDMRERKIFGRTWETAIRKSVVGDGMPGSLHSYEINEVSWQKKKFLFKGIDLTFKMWISPRKTNGM